MLNYAVALHVILALAAEPLPESAQRELKQLQGDWVLLREEAQGKKEELKAGDPKLILTFKGNKWIFDGQEKAVITAIDPKSQPKCMDLKSTEDGTKGKVEEAIYKVEGDILTICLYRGIGKQRPTKFETAQQPDTSLAVFKRGKKR